MSVVVLPLSLWPGAVKRGTGVWPVSIARGDVVSGVGCGRLTKNQDLDASVRLELATFDFETGIDFVGYSLCFPLPSFTFCPL